MFRGTKQRKPVLFVLNLLQRVQSLRTDGQTDGAAAAEAERTPGPPGAAAPRPGSGRRPLPAPSIASERNSSGGSS